MSIRSVNRTALIVKPKQLYIDWANSLDDEEPKLDPDNLTENTVYLIDEVASQSGKNVILRPYFKAIFEEELAAWHQLERDWPPKRDLATFLDWFDVEVHSLILDLGHQLLKTEHLGL